MNHCPTMSSQARCMIIRNSSIGRLLFARKVFNFVGLLKQWQICWFYRKNEVFGLSIFVLRTRKPWAETFIFRDVIMFFQTGLDWNRGDGFPSMRWTLLNSEPYRLDGFELKNEFCVFYAKMMTDWKTAKSESCQIEDISFGQNIRISDESGQVSANLTSSICHLTVFFDEIFYEIGNCFCCRSGNNVVE